MGRHKEYSNLRLLFITRKYPPSVGGMENVSYALAKELTNRVDTTVISWGGSQKYLPYFLLVATVKSIFLIPYKRINRIHLGDALLSPLGLFLRSVFGVKCSATVHGLDITFKLPIYQRIIPKCLASLDKVMCISKATLEECVKRGVPRSKCTVIPWGVYAEDLRVAATRNDLEKVAGIDLNNKKVLITVGRLVKRKGVYWFIEEVFPKLPRDFVYLVVGDGPERERVGGLIKNLGFEKRIKLLGKVSEEHKKVLYNTADLFVMPNIKVEGDIEGFGIVAAEALVSGLPVVATRIEGVIDALPEGEAVFLTDPEDSKTFIRHLNNALNVLRTLSRRQISKSVVENYSWPGVANKYLMEF